jgi:hypothetical protein
VGRLRPESSVCGLRAVRFIQPARFKAGQCLHLRTAMQWQAPASGTDEGSASAWNPPPALRVRSASWQWAEGEVGSRMDAWRAGFPAIERRHARGAVAVGQRRDPPRWPGLPEWPERHPYAPLYRLPPEIEHGPAFLAGRSIWRPHDEQLWACVTHPGGAGQDWPAEQGGQGWPGTLLNAILHVAFSLASGLAGRTLLPLRLDHAELFAPARGEVTVLARRIGRADGAHRMHVLAWEGASSRLVGVFHGFVLQEVD